MTTIAEILKSIEDDITSTQTRWQKVPNSDGLIFFTGVGLVWIIQVLATDGHRAATASSKAGLVVKLTDELTELAEKKAQGYFQ
jgi:hypothetical protein